MARRTIEIFVSDLSGEEIEEDEARTISFAYEGRVYSIDLSTSEGEEFDDAIKPYIDAAQKISTPRASRRSSAPAKTAAPTAKRDPAQTQAIRSWARENGWPDLGNRGRVPHQVEEAFEAAH